MKTYRMTLKELRKLIREALREINYSDPKDYGDPHGTPEEKKRWCEVQYQLWKENEDNTYYDQAKKFGCEWPTKYGKFTSSPTKKNDEKKEKEQEFGKNDWKLSRH